MRAKPQFWSLAACLACGLAGFSSGLVVGGETLSAQHGFDESEIELELRQMRALAKRIDQLDRDSAVRIDRAIGSLRRMVRPERDASDTARATNSESSANTGDVHVIRQPDVGSVTELGGAASFADWAEDEGVRDRWMLTGEEALLSAVGPPTTIDVRDSAEWWTYRLDGGRRVIITLNHGRVVGAISANLSGGD